MHAAKPASNIHRITAWFAIVSNPCTISSVYIRRKRKEEVVAVIGAKKNSQVVILPKNCTVLNPSVPFSPNLITTPHLRLTKTALTCISGLLLTPAPVGLNVSSSSSCISWKVRDVGESWA